MLTTPLKSLPFYPNIKRFLIAYSGGLDSHVLLHSLAKERENLGEVQLLAIHINHGLSANADQWVAHCAEQCAQLDVAFKQLKIDARAEVGESPEAAAREGRYDILASMMEEGDCLLTAHHQDDQAETLLLQLLRGAGPRGLAAMPAYAVFAEGWHARPLLAFRREQLLAYAEAAGLTWVDDESNSDTRYERNFLRHDILPLLKSRYPALAATLSRSAGLCAEAADLLAALARQDLVAAQRDDRSLSVTAVQALGEVRGRNLLHQWCRDRGLPTPSAAQLHCVWQEVIGAAADSEPLVSWPGAEARRFRAALFIAPPLPAHDADQTLPWDGQQELLIPPLGRLRGEPVAGQGIAASALQGRQLTIRFRQGGEQLRPVGRDGHHSLKKLFQEADIPPWQRDRIPLLYADDQLLAVAGLWVAHEAAARDNEAGLILRWSIPG
jgi:tRNA(Ile)-lysidine synthase